MSGKRRPTSDLNHDNWNVEETAEESGEFAKASADELKRRTIKVAKRRIQKSGDDGDSSESSKKSVFGSFVGFTSVPPKPDKIVGSESPASQFKFLADIVPAAAPSKPSVELTNGNQKSIDKKSNEYYGKIKGLNLSVLSWITKHVNENPLCILTPIFDDYSRYLKEIESSEASKTTITGFGSTSTITTVPPSFNIPKFSESSIGSIFSMGSVPPTTASTVTFGSSTNTATTASTSTSSGFSFGLTKPFTFSNVAKPATEVNDTKSDDQTDGDPDDQPPKVEFTKVIEDGSVYEKRCKVFMKSGADFTDRGVGTLYLKPVNGKTQLLVRADTNLGNILLNILLTDAVPTKRMGKNNVMMICMPTPDAKAATTVLVRVKTGEEADELLAEINKYKK